MGFTKTIEALYAVHGRDHALPFVGESFEDQRAGAFRIAAVGINPYLAPDQVVTAELHAETRQCWAAAGHGDAERFHGAAFKQVETLGCLLSRSSLFPGLSFDAEPTRKSGLYATNAIKVYLANDYKDASKVRDDLFHDHARTWHAELDTMAEYGVLPHVILVLGERPWTSMWQTFDAATPNVTRSHYSVTGYDECAAPCHHQANRITLSTAAGSHVLLLVRVTHPATRGEKRGAGWLLEQRVFRVLAGLS